MHIPSPRSTPERKARLFSIFGSTFAKAYQREITLPLGIGIDTTETGSLLPRLSNSCSPNNFEAEQSSNG